ncbi:chromosomal replication initiator protein DnaA [Helicobacter brantae]|uniref:Chromosomal replication initiator protein DnaA n=1 Tax=Helicobacter brantae TaxID=375927 RepID=A0A3D8J2F9_9HELI|nr:chromosomal replication initiator protein DnaA [Helicobacter brantae]RDU71396.1 chromosomal replication initiator protein DnaA [Helicobacter brantae]
MLGDEILEQLKNEVTQYEYETYISQMKYDAEASKSDLAVFYVPNLFLVSWVQTKYASKIAHLFEARTHIEPEIKICVKTQQKDVKTQQNEKIQKISVTKTFLNPSYTFESFVIGESNKFAFSIAQAVAQHQASKYNPVLIYGGTGLGKTHLLNAIGNQASQEGKNIIYVTAEQFLNDYTNHLNMKTMDRFREKYRKCDYLLIDDIQFFGGKDRTQDEFFHTFNELHNNQKQIVMTSDKHPRKIEGLEDRLRSRFEWGISADIIPPEIETKIAIVKQKCSINSIIIDEETINFIASNISNVRQIEGVLIKLNAQASIMGQQINLKMAKNAIKDNIKENHENITLDKIINQVARVLNIKPSEIKSKSRTKNVANARRYVIYLARLLTPNSMPVLAKELNMKDHSAISKAYKKMEQEMEESFTLKAVIEDIRNKIEEEQEDKPF